MTARRRTELLALIVLAGFVLAVALHYVQAYYYGKPYPFNTFLFNPGDKFEPAAPGIGAHFFGDFYGTWRQTRSPSAYLDPGVFYPSNYLPFTHLLLKPLSWLSYPIAVAIFLLGTLAATVLAFWRRIEVDDGLLRVMCTLILGCLTYPVLFALDRGNIDILLFLLLWVMIELFLREKWALAAVALSAAAAMKGTPGLLVLLFVPVRQWRAIALTVGLSALASLAGLAIMHGGIVDNYHGLRHALANFSGSTEQGTFALQHVTTVYGLLGVIAHAWHGFGGVFDAHGAIAAVLGVVCVGGALGLPLVLWERVTLLTVAIIMVPTITGDYRLTFMLLPVLLLLGDREAPRVGTLAVVLFGLLLIPKDLPILWADVGLGTLVNPLLMLALVATVLAQGAGRRRRGRAAAA